MKIHHLRNATFVIESGDHYILIDPMLSKKGELAPFAKRRHQPRRNPLVPLPDNANEILKKVTHCLITHSQKLGIKALSHTDHLDKAGKTFLRENKIPVICRKNDKKYLMKNGIIVHETLNMWESKQFPGGEITAVPAKHGHSWPRHIMANGAGFYLKLLNEPSIYISGDTVYTKETERALTELKPDISVVAAGSASLDVGGPILMTLEEIITFIEKSPGKVIANHLEALNHCPATRSQLADELKKRNLLSKTFIPDNGEILSFF